MANKIVLPRQVSYYDESPDSFPNSGKLNENADIIYPQTQFRCYSYLIIPLKLHSLDNNRTSDYGMGRMECSERHLPCTPRIKSPDHIDIPYTQNSRRSRSNAYIRRLLLPRCSHVREQQTI